MTMFVVKTINILFKGHLNYSSDSGYINDRPGSQYIYGLI